MLNRLIILITPARWALTGAWTQLGLGPGWRSRPALRASLPSPGQQRGLWCGVNPRREMCPETEKGVLAALLPSGGLSALAGVSRAPLQWSQRLSPFICDNLGPHWFAWESPAFKNHGCGCLIADQLRISGKGIWRLKGPWGGSHGQTGETTAASEHQHLFHFCAHQCGEASPESLGPEGRSDTHGKWSMIPPTQSACSQSLEAGKTGLPGGYGQSSVSGYAGLGAAQPFSLWGPGWATCLSEPVCL